MAGVPNANSRLDNSRSDKFVHSTPSRIGSPAVNSCNKARRFASRAGCATTHGGRPPLLCGCAQPPHPLSPRDRVDLDEWFWGRTPRPARCIRPRHGPAWRPQRPRTDGDPFPTTTQRSAASSLRSLLNTPPCSTPCAITYCGARILQLKHAGKLFLTISLAAPEVPSELRQRARVVTLRQLWQQHFERQPPTLRSTDGPGTGHVRLKPARELPPAADSLESPYDLDARYRRKRGSFVWTGSMVHVSETCGSEEAHLLTHVHTTPATVHEAQCTEPNQQALVDKALAPKEHVVDAASVEAALLVSSHQDHGIDVIGPTRPNVSWQTQVEGAYRREQLTIDWELEQVRCPQGNVSSTWTSQVDSHGTTKISVKFRRRDCDVCPERPRCTRAKTMPRHLSLHPRMQYAALEAARARFSSETGQELYKRRAGIEGTLSQGVRAFGLRRTRYRGLEKTSTSEYPAQAHSTSHRYGRSD